LADRLKEGLPDWISVSNPIDIWPIGMIGGNYTGAYGTALTELLRSKDVDGVLGVLPVPDSPLHRNLNMVKCMKDARKNSGNMKPLALWPYLDVSSFIDKFESIPGVACFDTVEQAVKGLSFCYRNHQAKKRHVPVQREFPVDHKKLGTIADKGRKERLLVGDEALLLLDLFGIPVVKSDIARGRKELENIASSMTYPLVLKLTGAAFLHKTEWGGVVTGIRDLKDLHRAFDRIVHNVSTRQTDVKVESVQVQEHIHGHELLLGLKRDHEFGHVVACGLGGIYTEVFKDISRAIVPVDQEEADGMLASLKIAPILKGLRGEAGIDWKGLVEILERLSFLASTLSDISELDINPVIATSNKCIAVDARILW